MKILRLLLFAIVLFGVQPVRGDFTFYGVRFPSRGPRTSGVVRTSVPNFPWLSVRKVRTLNDLERLIGKGRRKKGERNSSARPAIFYITSQSTRVEKSNLAQHDYFYFLQEDVKKRMDEYRWYWIYASSPLGHVLKNSYGLKGGKSLIIFEADGSVLHIESPINSPRSVAHAMRMIKYKRQMGAALEADIPQLKSQLEAGKVKVLVKYLERADKHRMYASERAAAILTSLRQRLSQEGGQRIETAEELARAGERQTALAILRDVHRDSHRMEVAKRADKVARRIRRQGS